MGLFAYISELCVALPPRLPRLDFCHCRDLLVGEVEALRRRREEQAKPLSEPKGNSSARHHTREVCTRVQNALENAETFAHHLMRLVKSKCNGRAALCYKRAGLSRQVYSAIIKRRELGGVRSARETVLRLAIGLRLSYEEAVALMASAGYAFCPSDEMDIVFATCLKSGIYSMFDVNDLLVSIGHEPFDLV